MNSKTKKLLRKIAMWLVVGLIAIQLLFFIFRNVVLHVAFNRAARYAQQHYGVIIGCSSIKFSGISTLQVKDLFLKPNGYDTLMSVREIGLEQSYLKLWLLKPSVSTIDIRDAYINLERNDTSGNYFFIFKKQEGRIAVTDTTKNINLASRYGRLLRFTLDLLTADTYLSNVNLHYHHNGYALAIKLPELISQNGIFQSKIVVNESGAADTLNLKGTASRKNTAIAYDLYKEGKKKFTVPFLEHKYNLVTMFDSLNFSLKGEQFSSSLAKLKLSGKIYGTMLNSPKLAQETVMIDSMKGSSLLTIGKNFFEVDSSSSFGFNKLAARLYARYQPGKFPVVDLKISTDDFPAENLFSSLPEGLFTNLTGILVSGTLKFRLDTHIDMAQPDSLTFSSNLTSQKFRILRYGQANLSKMDTSFEYTAYNHGVPVKTFTVGPENPEFRTLDQISPYLKNAVLTSEDGSFFWHHGFNEEAFKGALAEDLKKGEFARGGSTISMQLVKNVYLNQNKNIARKLEEMLIVWLIENNHLVSKEKMFETYLNIIEWGPNIYGASEASKFYFNKDVNNLNLSEAIFMAGVIPRPRTYSHFLDSTGHPKPFVGDYYRLVKNFMLRRGQITQEEYDNTQPIDKVTGLALELLNKPAMEPDSTQTDEDGIITMEESKNENQE
ncbi:MAG TPA: biosynthetic peptidoglycan transglycosylase [Williamwhitmania sp.]|nr:biosynthetic peptidoglycan transglycosylase [Williamwhitmania sp.]